MGVIVTKEDKARYFKYFQAMHKMVGNVIDDSKMEEFMNQKSHKHEVAKSAAEKDAARDAVIKKYTLTNYEDFAGLYTRLLSSAYKVENTEEDRKYNENLYELSKTPEGQIKVVLQIKDEFLKGDLKLLEGNAEDLITNYDEHQHLFNLWWTASNLKSVLESLKKDDRAKGLISQEDIDKVKEVNNKAEVAGDITAIANYWGNEFYPYIPENLEIDKAFHFIPLHTVDGTTPVENQDIGNLLNGLSDILTGKERYKELQKEMKARVYEGPFENKEEDTRFYQYFKTIHNMSGKELTPADWEVLTNVKSPKQELGKSILDKRAEWGDLREKYSFEGTNDFNSLYTRIATAALKVEKTDADREYNKNIVDLSKTHEGRMSVIMMLKKELVNMDMNLFKGSTFDFINNYNQNQHLFELSWLAANMADVLETINNENNPEFTSSQEDIKFLKDNRNAFEGVGNIQAIANYWAEDMFGFLPDNTDITMINDNLDSGTIDGKTTIRSLAGDTADKDIADKDRDKLSLFLRTASCGREALFDLKAQRAGKDIIKTVTPAITNRLVKLVDNSDAARGALRDSEQYNKFDMMVNICASMAKAITEAKAQGKSEMKLAFDSSKHKEWFELLKKDNPEISDKMSIGKMGLVYGTAFTQLQNAAREYIKYKMKDHTTDVKLEKNFKKLNSDDLEKLKVVSEVLSDAEVEKLKHPRQIMPKVAAEPNKSSEIVLQ